MKTRFPFDDFQQFSAAKTMPRLTSTEPFEPLAPGPSPEESAMLDAAPALENPPVALADATKEDTLEANARELVEERKRAMTPDITALVEDWRKAAEGVTPGPWNGTALSTAVGADQDGDGWTEVAAMPNRRAAWGGAHHRQWQKDAKWIARCSPSGISALLDALTAQAAELVEAREKLRLVDQDRVARGKLLKRARDMLVNPRDGLEDAGDLVSFGSTNDADTFRDAVEMLETWRWDDIMRERKLPDLVANCRKANDRAREATLSRDEALAALKVAVEREAGLRKALRSIAEPLSGTAIGDPWAFYADLQAVANAALSNPGTEQREVGDGR